MSVKLFLKDKLVEIILISLLILFIVSVLIIFKCNIFLIIYIPLSIVMVITCICIFEYCKKNKFYVELKSNLEALDKKYFITELLNRPEFLEGNILCDILEEVDKSMAENVNYYKYKDEEYKEYIELWVHEIKTPIASSKLVAENNKNEITVSIYEELDKIESYVEQVLYYSRSNNVEKDYIIKATKLDLVVNNVIIKNRKYFIENKISINKNTLISVVYTDSKWVEYIIEQVISNSIKYSRAKDSKITIMEEINKDNITLVIQDNGIGIDEKELNYIFDKGFTGKNGRKTTKSTGMGLYLSKKLCNKLGNSIILSSKEDEGTIVKIVFPVNSLVKEAL